MLGRGWQASGILLLLDGSPYSLLDDQRDQRDRIGSVDRLRVDLVPGGNNNPVLGGPDQYYDLNQFKASEPGFFGNLGRNTLIIPGVATFDLGLLKRIDLADEGAYLQFRAEFVNLFNRANFGSPDRDETAVDRDGDLNPAATTIIHTATTSRHIQFALKLLF